MKKEKNMQDRPKTVMLYLNSLHKGGAERVFAQLAGRFAEDGYRRNTPSPTGWSG